MSQLPEEHESSNGQPADWRNALQREWEILHREHEQSERSTAMLKAGAVLLSFATLAIAVDILLSGLLIMVLWVQEGITRTVQARVGARLLQIENMLRATHGNVDSAFQLHTTWQDARGGTMALVGDYARHALRPTVAYPYVMLLVILVIAWLAPTVG